MRILLDTITNDEAGEHGCDWAVIGFTPTYVKRLKKCLLQALIVRQSSQDFFRLEFYDRDIQFVEGSDELENAIISPSLLLPQTWMLSPDFPLTPTATETPTVVICPSGVYWEADTKSGVSIQTTEISHSDLEAIIDRVKVQQA
ncbi:MAG: hypothetical protein JST84_05380 [Acidobacteria bacterium]|nr:hypothetical protein [Acidobacteriota bacterium]